MKVLKPFKKLFFSLLLEIGLKMMIEDFQFRRPILITGRLCAHAGEILGRKRCIKHHILLWMKTQPKRKWIIKLKQLPFSLNAATGVSGAGTTWTENCQQCCGERPGFRKCRPPMLKVMRNVPTFHLSASTFVASIQVSWVNCLIGNKFIRVKTEGCQ